MINDTSFFSTSVQIIRELHCIYHHIVYATVEVCITRNHYPSIAFENITVANRHAGPTNCH